MRRTGATIIRVDHATSTVLLGVLMHAAGVRGLAVTASSRQLAPVLRSTGLLQHRATARLSLVPDALPFFGRLGPQEFSPAEIAEEECDVMIQDAEPSSVSVLIYQAPWDLADHSVGPILAHFASRRPEVRIYKTMLRRGTARGERIFELHRSRNFKPTDRPFMEVYRGSELISTLMLPQGNGQDRRGGPIACPLLTERELMNQLELVIDAAQQRSSANTIWRARRRLLLALRRVRHDIRRLDRYRASGRLSHRWEAFKQADMSLRGERHAFSEAQRKAARRKHLLGLLAHHREIAALHNEAERLERRRQLMAHLVLATQRCSPDGCVPV